MQRPQPVLILKDLKETADYLKSPLDGMGKWAVKSLYLCNLIEMMFSETGRRFAYNADVKKRAAQELGISVNEYSESDPLGLLVYNAQGYVDIDWHKTHGYEPFTQELIDRAGENGMRIEMPSGKLATVKTVNGTWFSFPKGARKRTYVPTPIVWVKLVK